MCLRESVSEGERERKEERGNLRIHRFCHIDDIVHFLDGEEIPGVLRQRHDNLQIERESVVISPELKDTHMHTRAHTHTHNPRRERERERDLKKHSPAISQRTRLPTQPLRPLEDS